MLCEQYGVRRDDCVHRGRYVCPPEGERVAITGITLSCSGSRSASDIRSEYQSAPSGSHLCGPLPASVHYLVDRRSNIFQLVPHNCYAQPTCTPSLGNPYLHILLEGDAPFDRYQLKAAARLACCLVREFGLATTSAINIIPLFDLDSSKDCLDAIPADFWTFLNACLLGEDRLYSEPEVVCCTELRAEVADLRSEIEALEDRIEALEARPDLTPRVEFLETAITTIGAQIGSITTQLTALQNYVYGLAGRIVKLEECFKKLPQCFETQPCGEAEYEISRCTDYPPIITQVINFDRKITDPDNIVSTGPLWCANLNDGFGPSRTYRVQGCVTIAARRWCVGKNVTISLKDCDGNVITVATWVAPSDGPQPAFTLCWDQVVPVPAATICCVRMQFFTNDVTEPFTQLCSGQIRLTRS